DAAGLAWAADRGIETRTVPHRAYASRQDFDAALAAVIDEYHPNYVLLAGFMRVLTPGFVERYEGRLINIRPSLLASFRGLQRHQQALVHGAQWHGCSIHSVTAKLDQAPNVAQGIVPVLETGGPDALAARLLTAEPRMYAEVVRWLGEGRVS